MSDPRRLAVLKAIVEDYVRFDEPVGSKALVERHHLGVSSATIRNDMALLEEEGLIAAPHTSAGRVPTDKGYRLFVDQLASVKPLSAPERKAIQSLLDGADDLDDVLERSARLLSQLTRQVAVVQYPQRASQNVQHLEFVSLSPLHVLVVLITDAGSVEQRNVELAAPISAEDLATLRAAFLATLGGQRVELVAQLSRNLVEITSVSLRDAAQRLGERLAVMARAGLEDRIVLAGTANLARSTSDFPLSIGPVLEALEEQVVMVRLLTEMRQDEHGVAISIGAEKPYDELSGTSIVATGYNLEATSKVGVLGPTRMDYQGSIAAVRAVARYLSRILAN